MQNSGRFFSPLTIRRFFEVMNQAKMQDRIDYSFKLERLDSNFNRNSVGNYTVHNRGKIVERFNQIFALSPNYEKVANASVNTVSEMHNEDVTLNPIEYAHTRFHPGASLMSINIKDDLKISCKDKNDAYIIQY